MERISKVEDMDNNEDEGNSTVSILEEVGEDSDASDPDKETNSEEIIHVKEQVHSPKLIEEDYTGLERISLETPTDELEVNLNLNEKNKDAIITEREVKEEILEDCIENIGHIVHKDEELVTSEKSSVPRWLKLTVVITGMVKVSQNCQTKTYKLGNFTRDLRWSELMYTFAIEVCGKNSVYLQRIMSIVKVYRICSAHCH